MRGANPFERTRLRIDLMDFICPLWITCVRFALLIEIWIVHIILMLIQQHFGSHTATSNALQP